MRENTYSILIKKIFELIFISWSVQLYLFIYYIDSYIILIFLLNFLSDHFKKIMETLKKSIIYFMIQYEKLQIFTLDISRSESNIHKK